jgi:hypothetical protein
MCGKFRVSARKIQAAILASCQRVLDRMAGWDWIFDRITEWTELSFDLAAKERTEHIDLAALFFVLFAFFAAKSWPG